MGMLALFLQTSSSGFLLWTLLVLLLVYLVSSFVFSSQEKGKEPPGPRSLPLLGNLLQLDRKRLHKNLLRLSKTYGSVFTIYLGPKKVVVLAGYKTVKEALVNYAEEFGEREMPPIMNESNQGHGLIWSNGDSWREMRRFALTNLRDFGMGKKACEDKIIEETDKLTEVLLKLKAAGESVAVAQPVHCALSNIVCSMVYGSRFEYEDPEFVSFINRTTRRVELMFSPSLQLYNIFPWLCKWLPSRKEFYHIDAEIRAKNLEIFSRLKETLNPQMCRGVVDAFLVQKKHLEDSGVTNSHFHDQNLLRTISNIFSAGTETVVSTVKTGLMLMAKNPEIQDQVQEELNRVVGGRQVQIEDRKNLPFTNAVIHEIQRLANVVPNGIPHKTSKDITFQGFFIKKGTAVYPLLTSVLFDESEWEKPHSFHPAHFLDKDGKFVKRDAFMPFSAGRRVCLGESLARMELFIFFSTLLQRFRFTPPPGVSEDELNVVNLHLGLHPIAPKL